MKIHKIERMKNCIEVTKVERLDTTSEIKNNISLIGRANLHKHTSHSNQHIRRIQIVLTAKAGEGINWRVARKANYFRHNCQKGNFVKRAIVSKGQPA